MFCKTRLSIFRVLGWAISFLICGTRSSEPANGLFAPPLERFCNRFCTRIIRQLPSGIASSTSDHAPSAIRRFCSRFGFLFEINLNRNRTLPYFTAGFHLLSAALLTSDCRGPARAPRYISHTRSCNIKASCCPISISGHAFRPSFPPADSCTGSASTANVALSDAFAWPTLRTTWKMTRKIARCVCV